MTDPTNVLLLLATTNPGKLREMVDILLDCAHTAPLPDRRLTIVSPGELGKRLQVAETGQTYAENAALKAQAFCEATGLITLADDSGLCVDALGGKPGVYTADWAERQWFEGPPGRDWYMAMGKVEGLLCEQGPDADRSGHFACVLALAWPDGENAIYEGKVPGTLTWPPRGTLGFGYDPIFVPQGQDQTFAEIDPAEKHRVSHRAAAFALLVAEQFGG